MNQVQQKPISQNFLLDRELVNQLIRESSITPRDMVLEIGPGQGIITQELLKIAQKVVAVEVDLHLFNQLKSRLSDFSRLKLVHQNFLLFSLPTHPYKVFSNIPFNITGDIVRKLLQSDSPPSDSYLIIQKQAASKFIADNHSNSMAAILYYPWWDISITHEFKRTDFVPSPKVDCVLLRIQSRTISLIDSKSKQTYLNLVSYHFSKNRASKNIPPRRWLEIFSNFLAFPNSQILKAIQESFVKLQKQQSHLHKIHRTRTDKNWKRFK